MTLHALRPAYLKLKLQRAVTSCPTSGPRFVGAVSFTSSCRSPCWRSTRWKCTVLRRRKYSALASPATTEDVVVPCRSNGEISLNIIRPHVKDDAAAPLILYLPSLPPRGLEALHVDDEKIIAALLASSNGTIVRLNYRAGEDAPYPTPVHDVLSGYDYIKERFAAESASWTTRTGRVKKTHLKIGVFGQLVGGSLAAMLGLTESHLAQHRVAAVAVNAPITDWVFPESPRILEQALIGRGDQDKTDEAIEKAVRRKRKRATRLPSWEVYRDEPDLATKDLEGLRSSLFAKPAHYFDPFASPVHFFRSAGSLVPADLTLTLDENDPLAALYLQAKPRKAHRNFPPSNSSLVLPQVRLSTGLQNPLYDSNEEFIKLLRRSVMRTAMNRATTQAMLDRFEEEPLGHEDRTESALQEAERKIEFHVGPGSGVWGMEGDKERWTEDVMRTGQWFREVLQ